MNYEAYLKKCERIRKENKKLILDFKKWLAGNNLSKGTIEKHVGNVDFYVNEFLLYEDAVEAKEGACKIDMFLGYWFIKKAMWSNKASIKENAVSLKKFYEFLFEGRKISEEDLLYLKESIKEGMPEWLATMERYDTPEIDDMQEGWRL